MNNSTKPCAFYNSPSGCKNGDKCQFSHSNSHNKEICKFFNSPGGCKYGEKCFFVHESLNFELEQQQNMMYQQYLIQQQYYAQLQQQMNLQQQQYDTAMEMDENAQIYDASSLEQELKKNLKQKTKPKKK
eukprot:gene4635-8208_t